MLSFHNKKCLAERSSTNLETSPLIYKVCIQKEKRVPFATSGKASLTVEAALVLPIFIFAVTAILFFIQAIQVQMRIQKAVYNNVMKVSGYAYYINHFDVNHNVESMFEAEYVRSKVIEEVGKNYLDNSYIVNGSRGLKAEMIMQEIEGVWDVKITYKMEVPFNIFHIAPIKFVIRNKCHLWIGDVLDEVYITKNGTVYHTFRDCSYISTSVLKCSYNDAKNNNLTACKICGNKNQEEVYYTKYGDRFHCQMNCSALKSNVLIMNKVDAEKKYTLCSKCEKRMDDGG